LKTKRQDCGVWGRFRNWLVAAVEIDSIQAVAQKLCLNQDSEASRPSKAFAHGSTHLSLAT
jgi:hypothetical protein